MSKPSWNAALIRDIAGFTALLLVMVPLVGAQHRELDDSTPQEVQEIRILRQEISLLNLLNGLYLSDDQLEQLIELSEQAAQVRERYQRALAGKADGYLQDLGELRDTLYTTASLTPKQREEAFHRERQVELEPRDRAAEELGRLEDRARRVLSEGQLAIIESFKPCLIPPQSLADPVAVGQASTSEHEERILDVIRRMPEYLYRQRRREIAETVVSWGEREKGKLPVDVRAATIGTYLDKLDHLRTLSAVDYELQRSELAEAFQLFDDEVTYHNGHTRELGKLSQLLLNRQAAEVLQRWQDSRKALPSGTAPVTAAQADPREQQLDREYQGVARYRGVVEQLLRERVRRASLSWSEGQSMDRSIARAMALTSPEEQLRSLAEIADRLNRLSLTPASIRSAYGYIMGLSYLKQVPGVVTRGHEPPQPVPDITGLGKLVTEASRDAEQGQLESAYTTLRSVITCLEDFS